MPHGLQAQLAALVPDEPVLAAACTSPPPTRPSAAHALAAFGGALGGVFAGALDAASRPKNRLPFAPAELMAIAVTPTRLLFCRSRPSRTSSSPVAAAS